VQLRLLVIFLQSVELRHPSGLLSPSVFNVLKVPFHPHFEVLLRVADIDLVSHFTGNPVNDYWHPVKASILTLAQSSFSSAVAVSHLEVHRLGSFCEFF
jgi:hypothetical protein